MGPHLGDAAALHRHDHVGVLDGRKPVRDHEHRAPARQAGERRLHRALALVVQRARRLVEDDDRRVLEEHARDGDALFLPARQARAVLADRRVVAHRQRAHELVDVGLLGRGDDLVERGVGAAVGDVLADGAVEQVHVLLHQADAAPQARAGHVAHVDAVDAHRPRAHVVEARDERAGRRLAAARGAHERHGRAGLDAQRQVVDDVGCAVVAEAHVVEVDGARADLQVRGAGLVLDVGLGVEDLAEALEARRGLLKHLGEVDERLDGRRQDADVEGEDRQVGHVERAGRHQVAAEHDDDGVEQARQRRARRHEVPHGVIGVGLRPQVGLVGGGEAGALVVLGHERLHDAHALQRVLELRVHPADLDAVVVVGRLQRAVLDDEVDHRERGQHRDGEAQLPIDRHHDGDHADDLDAADDDVLGTVVGGLADVEQVVDDAAHHVAGLDAVVPGEREALVLVEQVLAHAGLHAHAHDVTPRAHEVAARVADGIHGQKAHEQDEQGCVDPVGRPDEQAVGERAQDLGERQVDAGHDERAEHVGPEQVALGPVVREEAAEDPGRARPGGAGGSCAGGGAGRRGPSGALGLLAGILGLRARVLRLLAGALGLVGHGSLGFENGVGCAEVARRVSRASIDQAGRETKRDGRERCVDGGGAQGRAKCRVRGEATVQYRQIWLSNVELTTSRGDIEWIALRAEGDQNGSSAKGKPGQRLDLRFVCLAKTVRLKPRGQKAPTVPPDRSISPQLAHVSMFDSHWGRY